MSLQVVILAAGKGTRMKSTMPKVLHPLAGRPLLAHVINNALMLQPASITLIVGHESEAVKQDIQQRFPRAPIQWVEQKEQLGTAHAIAQALPTLQDDARVLILYGDVPLLRIETLQKMVNGLDTTTIHLLTAKLSDPTGYGRIVRDISGQVRHIVEEKDADTHTRSVQEINTGIIALTSGLLRQFIPRINNHNAQKEYYLTDMISLAVEADYQVQTFSPIDTNEIEGVNDKVQLACLERCYQRRQADQLMRAGVTLLDPNRFDLRGEVIAGQDVVIDVNVILEGEVSLGDRVKIGPGCILKNVQVASDAVIQANTVIENSVIGPKCEVGPFARLRPGTKLDFGAKVGNFVEIKKSEVGVRSKVNHLTYVGDTEIGTDVNIGAGTITCNYDGVNKHKTIIGDGVFIGSNTSLVAPVTIEDGATIGAGSTITKNAPKSKLTLARSRQMTIPGWSRPEKQ